MSGRPAERVRLYTHNIYARRAQWDGRRRVLLAGLAELDPDVVLLQEEVRTRDYDQTADLVGPEWHVVHSAGRSEDEGSGISVASRWPLTAVDEIDLTVGGPPIDEYAWAALVVQVEAPAPIGRFLVANHFPDATVDRENERERQAVVLARRLAVLAERDDVPVLIAGDLDAEPDAASLRFLTGRQSVDGFSVAYVRAWDVVHPGESCWTLDPANPLHAAQLPGWPYHQIDHVLVKTGRSGTSSFTVEACELVHTRPRDGVWASDHFGLVTDLRICLPQTAERTI